MFIQKVLLSPEGQTRHFSLFLALTDPNPRRNDMFSVQPKKDAFTARKPHHSIPALAWAHACTRRGKAPGTGRRPVAVGAQSQPQAAGPC